MSKPLDVGLSELRRSFFVLSKVAEKGASPPHFLLLFYAVECGLKARILRKFDKWKLSHINKNVIDNIYTHDLSCLAKKAGITVQDIGHLQLNRSEPLTIKKVHQAWRYGVVIAADDEKKVVNWLKKLQEKIKRGVY